MTATAMRHGLSAYKNGRCRCVECRRANRHRRRQQHGVTVPEQRDQQLDEPWVLINFPVALVARQAFPDDAAAIAAAFPQLVPGERRTPGTVASAGSGTALPDPAGACSAAGDSGGAAASSEPAAIVGDGAGSDGTDRVGSEVPCRQITHAAPHVRPSPTHRPLTLAYGGA